MQKIPVPTKTINMQTGEVVEESVSQFDLLPPHPDACQSCGKLPTHPPEYPHDAQSMYYQYSFYGEHGRWPTWKDAMAHCSEAMQGKWKEALRSRGVIVE